MSVEQQEIAALIEQAYAALAFDPGTEPDWSAFDACFVDQAILALRVFPQDPAVSVLRLHEYASWQMRNGLGTEGYSETPGKRDIRVVGDIAVVYQHFSMNFASGAVQAIDVFSLVRTEAGWRIVSVLSDVARPAG